MHEHTIWYRSNFYAHRIGSCVRIYDTLHVVLFRLNGRRSEFKTNSDKRLWIDWCWCLAYHYFFRLPGFFFCIPWIHQRFIKSYDWSEVFLYARIAIEFRSISIINLNSVKRSPDVGKRVHGWYVIYLKCTASGYLWWGLTLFRWIIIMQLVI